MYCFKKILDRLKKAELNTLSYHISDKNYSISLNYKNDKGEICTIVVENKCVLFVNVIRVHPYKVMNIELTKNQREKIEKFVLDLYNKLSF